MQSDSSLPALSLLWPSGVSSASPRLESLSASAADDLNLLELVRAMIGGGGPPARVQQRERFTCEILSQLCQQPDVIAYRQGVLEHLIANPPLRDRLGQILATLQALSHLSIVPQR